MPIVKPISAYMLNLTFDQADPALASGFFVPNASDPTSKVWYTLPSSWSTAPLPAQGSQVKQAAALSSWGSPVSDSQSLRCNLNDLIYIRVAPRNGWSNLSSMQLRFSSVFGRAPGASNDTVATPFVLSNDSPCTLYTTDTSASTTQQDFTPPGPDNSWIYYLGVLSQNAVGQKARGQGSGNNRRLYAFIVGITVIDSGGNWYTYGHDPGMDVNG